MLAVLLWHGVAATRVARGLSSLALHLVNAICRPKRAVTPAASAYLSHKQEDLLYARQPRSLKDDNFARSASRPSHTPHAPIACSALNVTTLYNGGRVYLLTLTCRVLHRVCRLFVEFVCTFEVYTYT